jgi:hypothetical protein
MAMKQEDDHDNHGDWLNAVGVVGFVLFAGPFIYTIFAQVSTALVHATLPVASSGESNIDSYVSGMISFLGFMCIAFVAFKRFWQGFRTKEKNRVPTSITGDETRIR